MTKIKKISLCFLFVAVFFACGFFAFPANFVYALEDSEVLPTSFNLKDEIAIPTKNQGGYGLCWAFTSNRVIETFLLKNFNYSINLSESWASLAYVNYVNDDDYEKSYSLSPNFDIENYIYGNAAHYLNYQNAMNSYGFATESNVPYNIGSEISTENYTEIFNTYKDFASKDLVTNIKFDWCGNYDEDIAKADIEKEVIVANIKDYVYNYGGVYTAVYTGDLSTIEGERCLYSSNGLMKINHAVTIIGYDDNFNVSISGEEHQGAFIVVNSYGIYDEYFYVLYDDYNLIRNCYYLESLRYNDVQMELSEVAEHRVLRTDPLIVIGTLEILMYVGGGVVFFVMCFVVPTTILKAKTSRLNKKLTAQRIIQYRTEQQRIASEHELIKQRMANFKEEMRKREERRIKRLNNS